MLSSRNAVRAKWPRGQKFRLTALGDEAELQYREAVIASRVTEGRQSFDTARSRWALSYRLQPDDGLYLAEVRLGNANLQQVIAALDTSGKTRNDAITALERLESTHMIAPA